MISTVILNSIPYLISLGSVIATFYGIQHTNRVNAKLQERKFIADQRGVDREAVRAKGEELFMLINSFKADLSNSVAEMSTALLTEGKYQAAGATDIDGSNAAALRIELLTLVYFPKVRDKLEVLKTHHGAILFEMMKIVQCKPTEHGALVARLMEMSAKMTEITYDFQKSIVESLRKMGAGIEETDPHA